LVDGIAPSLARVDFGRRTQHPRHRLEAGLGNVVAVGAIKIGDMQRDAGMLRKRLEPFAHQFGVEVPILSRGNSQLKTRKGRPETSMATRVKVSSMGRSQEA
jgi:hypothetical protein